MTDTPRTYEIRIHWTSFGCAVAVVRTAWDGPGVDTRRSEMISRDFGLKEHVPEMIESAVTNVLMMLSELPEDRPGTRDEWRGSEPL